MQKTIYLRSLATRHPWLQGHRFLVLFWLEIPQPFWCLKHWEHIEKHILYIYIGIKRDNSKYIVVNFLFKKCRNNMPYFTLSFILNLKLSNLKIPSHILGTCHMSPQHQVSTLKWYLSKPWSRKYLEQTRADTQTRLWAGMKAPGPTANQTAL